MIEKFIYGFCNKIVSICRWEGWQLWFDCGYYQLANKDDITWAFVNNNNYTNTSGSYFQHYNTII